MKSNILEERVPQVPHFLLMAGKTRNTLKKKTASGHRFTDLKMIFLEDKITLLEKHCKICAKIPSSLINTFQVSSFHLLARALSSHGVGTVELYENSAR